MVPSVSQANEVTWKYSVIKDAKVPLSSKATFTFAISIQLTTHRTVSQYEESPQVLSLD